MNKKIVILHPAFWEQAMGGAEIQIQYLVEFLLEENVRVHFIFEDKGIKYDYLTHHNLILHPLKKINLSKRFGNRWFLYKKRINLLLNQIEPDGIYTRFFSSWSGFASMYAIKSNIPHVWALASDNDLKVLKTHINLTKPLNIFENNYVRKAFLKATEIIVQNDWQAFALNQLHHRSGTQLKQAAPPIKVEVSRKDRDTLKIVWIANMKPLKRPDILINIAQHYRSQLGISFKMIGRLDIKYKEQINEEEKLNSNFEYMGELRNDEVNNILLDSDILINTSDYEGFSNTFIQAWMRKNIVISMNSNPDQILNKYNVGFLCSSLDEIVEKISLLRENRNSLREMQNLAYEYAKKEHNLDVNLNIIKKLLKLN